MAVQTPGCPQVSVLAYETMKKNKTHQKGARGPIGRNLKPKSKELLTTEELDKLLAEIRNYRVIPDIAQTLGDASTFVGVPLGVIKAARSSGCLAFARSGRIRVFELIEWLEAHHECWTMAGLATPPKDWKATPSWGH